MLWIFSSIFSNKKNILKTSKNDNSFTRCLPSPTCAHPFDAGQNNFAFDIFSWLYTFFLNELLQDCQCHCNYHHLLAVSIIYVPKLVISWSFLGLRLTLESHQYRQVLFLYFNQFTILSDMRKEISSFAHLSLPLSNGWVALSFLFVCSFVRPSRYGNIRPNIHFYFP